MVFIELGLGVAVYNVKMLALIAIAIGMPSDAAIARIQTRRFSQDGWQLADRDNAFADRVHCALWSSWRHILFRPKALGFRVGKISDTMRATYWIGDGRPVEWQDRYLQLIANDAAIDGPRQSDPRSRVSLFFHLDGFAQMLGKARSLGYTADAAFAA